MAAYTGPDFGKVKLAKALEELSTSCNVALSAEVAREVEHTLASYRYYTDAAKRQRTAEQQRADEKAAILAGDEKIEPTQCEQRIYHGSLDYRGSRCSTPAKFRRTWTTKEFDGLYLDGKKVEDGQIEGGWELGKGFVKRDLTEDEMTRAERRYKTTTHTATLCGTHRRIKGQYGFPY